MEIVMAKGGENKIDNTLFISTFAGVVLLLLTIFSLAAGIRHSLSTELSVLVAALPGTSSLVLLYKSIRKDKSRADHAH